MAGSYDHLIDVDENEGKFTMEFIENMGGAEEALEECFHIINHLSGGDKSKIKEALKSYYNEV